LGLFSRKTKKEDFQQVNLPEITLSNGVLHQFEQQVDCTGSSCPRPQMMTKKAVNVAQTNDVVEIIVDNLSSMEAVPPMRPQIWATHLETKQTITPGKSTLEKIDSALQSPFSDTELSSLISYYRTAALLVTN